jgi:acetyl-CoA acetyltransferase
MTQESEPSIRGRVAVVGIGETTYYKRGAATSPEFVLGLEAILNAVEDAGLSAGDLDGFSSFSNDRNEPVRFASALGLPEFKFSSMVWGGGGGGGSAAVANAAAAVAAGYANYVVVYRALAQGQFDRFGQAAPVPTVSGHKKWMSPYGMFSPGQQYAMRVQRFMHDHNIEQDALKAIALTSYYHAQQNPRAVMHGRPLTAEKYDESRWIVEPFHLYDCCMENDGAAALIVTTPERAEKLKQPPVYVLAACQGSDYRQAAPAHNAPDYATSNFKTLAPRLYETAGITPDDVDVAQVYENFTGGVLMSIVEHGLCAAEDVNDFFKTENFRAPDGKLPINTSGGNLAECYMHGLELITEAVRQIRGSSTNQVRDAKVSLVVSGPMVQPVSNLVLASERSVR